MLASVIKILPDLAPYCIQAYAEESTLKSVAIRVYGGYGAISGGSAARRSAVTFAFLLAATANHYFR